VLLFASNSITYLQFFAREFVNIANFLYWGDQLSQVQIFLRILFEIIQI